MSMETEKLIQGLVMKIDRKTLSAAIEYQKKIEQLKSDLAARDACIKDLWTTYSYAHGDKDWFMAFPEHKPLIEQLRNGE